MIIDIVNSRSVYVVDDDSMIRRSLSFYLSTIGYSARPFICGADFLTELPALSPGCVILDIRMPDKDGLQVINEMGHYRGSFPVIFMTGHGDVAAAVRAMRFGAYDFLEKPYEEEALLRTLEEAWASLDQNRDVRGKQIIADAAIQSLTTREYEVLSGLASGAANKEIAYRLDISVRTVEMHRARMMRHLGTRSLAEALRLFHMHQQGQADLRLS